MISKRKRPCASLPPPQHQLSTSSSLSFLPALTFLFLLCLTPLLTSAEWDGVAITQADYEGLQAIKHDLSDPTGALRTWNDTGLGGACSGSWEGIKCVKGQVVAISLPWHGLTGTISPKVGQLTALKRISLHDNFLHGPVPAELGLLPDLRGVYLFNNRLSGAVPPEIGTGCKLLQALDLSNNQLVGSIPESLAAAGSAGSTGKLFRLNLSYNFLSGPIPAGLALSGSLTFISLQHNNLSGDVPDTWGSGGSRNGSVDGAAYQLQVLELDHNVLSGTVPASLGRLPQLQVLTLGGNQLNGTIPSDLGKLSGTIQTLDLSGNSIGGTFPAALCNLSSLSRLDLGGNQIDGDLPAAIGGLKNLTYLSLKGNKINGPIPAELGNATSLSWLDLSGNSFDGEIPESIANLTKLASFDVSNNNLTGPVPVALAERFNSSSFRGNIQLCGYKAAPPCPLPSPPPSTSSSPASSPSSSTSLPLTFPSSGTGETSNTNGRRHRLSTREVILIVCGCVLAVMLLLCCVLLWCLVRNRVLSSRASAKQRSIAAGAAAGRDDKPGGIAAGGAMEESSGDTGGRLVHFEGALVFTADDLLCATAEIMGKSAYGTVYKATLEDGNQVTVKRLREKVAKGPREFETEVSVLGGIRHPNLLELRAYYLGPKGEKLLVFDYMPKGSLAAYLHARGPDTTIDWPTRMGIAMGITRGILYLHTHHGIVHGNMTSANILLDDTPTPKIADYGLSRLMTAAAAAGTGAVATAGALGYRAPELAKMKKPTAKTDVYSLGVVILELLTGKSPGESMNGVGLPQWVANIVKEEWTNEVFDLELMRNAEGNPSEVDELLNTLKLALHCVDPSPAARPEVQQVLKQLEEIKPELAETGGDVTAGAGGSGTGEGMPAQTTESD